MTPIIDDLRTDTVSLTTHGVNCRDERKAVESCVRISARRITTGRVISVRIIAAVQNGATKSRQLCDKMRHYGYAEPKVAGRALSRPGDHGAGDVKMLIC